MSSSIYTSNLRIVSHKNVKILGDTEADNSIYFYVSPCLFFPSILCKKAVPLQAWSGPEGSRKLRCPDFMTTAQDGGKVASPTHRPPSPPVNAPGTHFCYRLSRPQGHSAIGRILCQWKIPMTPSGIEPATFRFVAQHLHHPYYVITLMFVVQKCLNIQPEVFKVCSSLSIKEFHTAQETKCSSRILQLLAIDTVTYKILPSDPLCLYLLFTCCLMSGSFRVVTSRSTDLFEFLTFLFIIQGVH